MIELYGTSTCQYTAEMREDLRWQGKAFVEYDVETDSAALERLSRASNGNRMVPVLIEDGRVLQIGMHGRGCYINAP